MRDLAFVGFLVALFGLGLRRPFVFVLGYAYIDIVSPQRLSYYLLNAVPISLIFFVAAVLGWLVADDKRGVRIAPRQIVLMLLLGWAAFTTAHADFPVEALDKWDWVWKSLIFAIFLPFTLRTRLRMEALLVFMIVSAASIIIIGGIKTLASGGGYGALNLGLSNNSGLYEGEHHLDDVAGDDPDHPVSRASRHDLPARVEGATVQRSTDLRLPAHPHRY